MRNTYTRESRWCLGKADCGIHKDRGAAASPHGGFAEWLETKNDDDDSGAPRAETTPRTERASGEIV